MPTLPSNYNWGASFRNQNPELTRQISDSREQIVQCVNTKISKYTTDGVQRPHVNAPASSQLNRNFDIGDIYVRTDTNTAWIMTSRTTDEAVTWTLIT